MSRPPYDSMNVAEHVGDEPLQVSANRARLAQAAGLPAEPYWLTQTHGVDVVEAGESGTSPVEADAAFACAPGRVCTVMTADCLPVLLASKRGDCVAAAHAGWRGLVNGVLEATVQALPAEAENLLAWLGPAIGPGAFEVGEEVRQAFMDRQPRAAACFTAHGQRWLADLYGLARQRLGQCGVQAIYGGGFCTFTEASRFFSYRRDAQCGRMATLIWLQ